MFFFLSFLFVRFILEVYLSIFLEKRNAFEFKSLELYTLIYKPSRHNRIWGIIASIHFLKLYEHTWKEELFKKKTKCLEIYKNKFTCQKLTRKSKKLRVFKRNGINGWRDRKEI